KLSVTRNNHFQTATSSTSKQAFASSLRLLTTQHKPTNKQTTNQSTTQPITTTMPFFRSSSSSPEAQQQHHRQPAWVKNPSILTRTVQPVLIRRIAHLNATLPATHAWHNRGGATPPLNLEQRVDLILGGLPVEAQPWATATGMDAFIDRLLALLRPAFVLTEDHYAAIRAADRASQGRHRRAAAARLAAREGHGNLAVARRRLGWSDCLACRRAAYERLARDILAAALARHDTAGLFSSLSRLLQIHTTTTDSNNNSKKSTLFFQQNWVRDPRLLMADFRPLLVETVRRPAQYLDASELSRWTLSAFAPPLRATASFAADSAAGCYVTTAERASVLVSRLRRHRRLAPAVMERAVARHWGRRGGVPGGGVLDRAARRVFGPAVCVAAVQPRLRRFVRARPPPPPDVQVALFWDVVHTVLEEVLECLEAAGAHRRVRIRSSGDDHDDDNDDDEEYEDDDEEESSRENLALMHMFPDFSHDPRSVAHRVDNTRPGELSCWW
ncbi:hypothetical protein GGR56DRAFT_693667, partial [Xylariaceae sp. FL0804]